MSKSTRTRRFAAAFTLTGLLALSAPSWAKQTWECLDAIDERQAVLIAIVNDDGKTGRLHVAGAIHDTDYRVDGISGVWLWGLEDGSYRFTFQILPSGMGLIIDFGSPPKGEAEPSAIFVCSPAR